MSHTRSYLIADPRQMALHSRRRRVGILAYVVAQLAGITSHELAAIESGRKIATPEQIANVDAVLRPFERAQARILRASEARSGVKKTAPSDSTIA